MFFKLIFKGKKKKIKEQVKLDFNNWMNLTKEERMQIDSNQKNESMRKKKALLKSIRDEYTKIRKKI